jgi:uncharacterized lipoprotein YehR (DUF1307 family)
MKKGAKNSVRTIAIALVCAFVIASCGSKQGCAAYGEHGKHHKLVHR